ncbi:MAG: hypothetical protein C0436_00030 [Alphaproteobacteria bacterium]|nr:hypothetical protein [Alphaproteobacteria bacterium]
MITTMALVKTLGKLYDITGTAAPTTSTVGELFDTYLNTSTGLSYTLNSITAGPPVAYNWVADTSRDAEINIFIRRAETDYKAIRGIDFGVVVFGGTAYPDDADVVAAEMVCYLMGLGRYDGRGKQDEALSSRSATYDAKIHGYPRSVVGTIERYQSAK